MGKGVIGGAGAFIASGWRVEAGLPIPAIGALPM